MVNLGLVIGGVFLLAAVLYSAYDTIKLRKQRDDEIKTIIRKIDALADKLIALKYR